jgi:putative transposase
MAWLNRQLAMCVKRLRRWEEVVWEPNVAYSAVELTGPSEVLDKVAYVSLNPVSAALVPYPERWPGAVSTLETLSAGGIKAERPSVWFKDSAPGVVHLALSTPPCFSEQTDYLQALETVLDSRLLLLHTERRRKGLRYLGSARVRRTLVTDQPRNKKERFGRSPAFSALTQNAWRLAYREAYRVWRGGHRRVAFPAGTWWVVRCAGAAAAT